MHFNRNKSLFLLKVLYASFFINTGVINAQCIYITKHLNLCSLNMGQSLMTVKNAILNKYFFGINPVYTNSYEKHGNYKSGLAYKIQYNLIDNSRISLKTLRKADKQLSKYKSHTEIVYPNQTFFTKYTGIGLTIAATIIVVMAFLLFRLYKDSVQLNYELNKQKDIIHKGKLEKELLLNELNHRVKNNLQMISSLLNLQANQLKGLPAAESLQAGRSRIEALSLVHQMLYQKDQNTKVALDEYFEELILNQVHCYNKKVALNLKIDKVDVKIDTAIQLGLIINELITNSLKYAFKNHNSPSISVSVKIINKILVLSITDNGEGIPNSRLKGTTNSFGLKLVHSLIKQLNAQIIYKNTKGANWNINVINY